MRGDKVEIVIDAGGEVRTYEVVATRNGRRVDINTGRGIVEVPELAADAPGSIGVAPMPHAPAPPQDISDRDGD